MNAGGAALGSLLLLVACAWYSLGSARRHHLMSDAAVYAFAAAGALSLARFALRGGL